MRGHSWVNRFLVVKAMVPNSKTKNVDFALCWLREVDVSGLFEVRRASVDAISARCKISEARLRDD
jgi:hypothetical protein